MRFSGTVNIKVEGPTGGLATISELLAKNLRGIMDADFPEVHDFSVVIQDNGSLVVLKMTIDGDAEAELDRVTDRVLEVAFRSTTREARAKATRAELRGDLHLLGSALAPA